MTLAAQCERATSRGGRKIAPAERFIVMEFKVQIDAPVTMREGPLATLLYRSPRIARLISEAVAPEVPKICSAKVQEIEK